MSDSELVCNFKKCRKRITSHAWVTSCSHVFCEEDGEREFTSQSPIKCPACNTLLPRSIDVIKVDLNPSEQFKAMVLAGLRPEIVMDIASRAIAFWSYQVHLEHMYQENSVKTYRERLSQLEVSYEALVAKIKSEMTGLKRQIEAARKDLAIQMRRAEELAEKLVEKTRQCQKLQAMYDSMKRTTISSTMLDHHQKDSRHQSSHPSFTLGPRTIADVLPQQSMSMPPPPMSPHHHHHNHSSSTATRVQQHSSHQEDFTFRPVTPSSGLRSGRGPLPFQAMSHHMQTSRGPNN